jgi:hypothetical protein
MMFSTGFKYFFGVTVLSVVALVMSVALFKNLALIGVAITFLIAAGALLAGLAIITARFKPSSPNVFNTNSFTSRPRSPTNPTTTISALVNFVIMPSRILFPTPVPANKPMR